MYISQIYSNCYSETVSNLKIMINSHTRLLFQMKRVAVGDDKNASSNDARDFVLPPPLLLQSLKTYKDDGDSHLLVFNIDALISMFAQFVMLLTVFYFSGSIS